jgi:clan AA aspartic protease (TIGR02281 family)
MSSVRFSWAGLSLNTKSASPCENLGIRVGSTMIGKIALAFLVLLTLVACHASSGPAALSAACGERPPDRDALDNAQWSQCINKKPGRLVELFGSTDLHRQKHSSPATTVSLQQYRGGTFLVPVTINGRLTLMFMVDSGATDVSIPADVVLTLMRTGTLTDDDFLGETSYTLADGSAIPSQAFRLQSLKVGEMVLENVIGGVTPGEAQPLLGQSFLGRFKSWSIDNTERVLVLEE